MSLESNPYATPEASVLEAKAPPVLGNFTPAEIKKLYYRSCNVIAIAGLMIFGCLIVGAVIIGAIRQTGTISMEAEAWVGLGFFLTCIVGTIGVTMRTGWGRIAGIVACCIMLLKIPIGTIIGIVGLFAFFKAKELFGNGRIHHGELKTAYRAIKRLP